VVAFQALKAAGINSVDEISVEIKAGNTVVNQIVFDEDNIDLTYLIDLRPYLKETTQVTITSMGVGQIMYQVYYEEYIPWSRIGVDQPQELLLDISYDTTNIKVNDRVTATLDLKYIGAADHVKMVLVDLRAPIGFSFVAADFEAMMSTGSISQYEINDRQAYLYLEDLVYNQTITVTYQLEATDPIHGTVQGINAYDMYNPDLTVELEPVAFSVTE
jgi:hypothetical protein